MIHVHSRWLNHVESTSQPHQQNLIGRIHSKTAQYFYQIKRSHAKPVLSYRVGRRIGFTLKLEILKRDVCRLYLIVIRSALNI